jgi:hypothetical protein
MVEGMGREQMRAADADRQRVAEHLRAALDEGRLDLHEYDERLQRAYAAKTYGDLDGLLADLPGARAVLPAAPAAVQPAAGGGGPTAEWLGQIWGSWFFVVGVTTVVWGVSSLAAAEVLYFWPVWVAIPWGLALVVATLGGLAKGAPQKMVADRERKALAKERRRERRALQAEAIARGELPPNPTKEQRREFIARAVARGELPPKPDKA